MRKNSYGLVFHFVVHHFVGVPWGWVAAEVFVEPFEVGVVIHWHRVHGVGPVAVIAEHNQA